MREKEIAIPAFRGHLYGTEIVTVRHFFFALKSPCGASKPHPAYHLFQTVLARVRLSASVILASRYPLSMSAGVRMNAINVISPYRHHGMWVFDDARVGLVQEPFVSGADT